MASKVRDIMTTNVESIAPDRDLVAAARMMKELNVGSLPVVKDDRLIGIITDRDIVIRAIAEGREPLLELVESHLTADPTTISPDADVQQASQVMAQEQIRRLPVVDGNRLVGILAIGDLAVDLNKDKLVGNVLEQISEPAKPRSNERGA
jgi:CBS domain-containing protein